MDFENKFKDGEISIAKNIAILYVDHTKFKVTANKKYKLI